MIYTGTIISTYASKNAEAIEYLKKFKEVEVYTSSDDLKQIVTAIETENNHTLEELCKKIKENDLIIEVSHNYFYFEDEVEKMTKEEQKENLKELFKSFNTQIQ